MQKRNLFCMKLIELICRKNQCEYYAAFRYLGVIRTDKDCYNTYEMECNR